MSFRLSRRPRLSVLAAVTGLAAAAITVLAPPAHSAPSAKDPAACPDAYPVAALTAHQPVDGLTVSSGNTPDTFTGEVLGVLHDGIAPGLDMIMVQLTSTEIDRVGIWAGMSGSPVYAANGQLIGAVSYGLSFGPSPVAGVTPAADMRALLNGTLAPASARLLAGTEHVALPQRLQQRLVSEGLATPAQADEGLTRLPLPMSISSRADSARLSKAASQIKAPSLMGLSGVRIYQASAAPAAPAADTDIFPGSNLAASISYGDFTAAGIGTTTMVCAGQVVGFGHPFNWTGDSSLTMHSADTIYVQADPTLTGFKVANPTGPVGGITGDHLAGISGPLGQIPAATNVHSVATLTTTGNSRTGDTYVSVPDFLPDVTLFAQLSNQDRVFDRIGQGSSLLHFTIDGSTPDGEPFTLVRTNRFASPYDISFESVFEPAEDVYAINSNNFTDVTIDEVRISTRLSPDNRVFSVGKVERQIGTTYTTLSSSTVVKARAGSTVALRVTLTSYRNRFGTKVVMLYIKVPVAPVGSYGSLTVSGLGGTFGGSPSATATSFDNLLAKLAAAPRNDQLRGEIDLFSKTTGRQLRSSTTNLVRDVVQGRRSFAVQITR
jgi:hypothetical protein